MKYFNLLIPVAGAFLLISCGAKQKTMTESDIQAKVDSLVGVKMEELNMRYMEDLEKRMAIEVKVKADSIVAARKAQQP